MRLLSVTADLDEESGGEAAATETCTTSCNAASPLPAASDAQRSHISETPTKSRAHDRNVECTSRPGEARSTPQMSLL